MAWPLTAEDVAVLADLLAEMRAPAMTALRWLWAGNHYWPIWLGVTVGTFLLREVWALASGRHADTLSSFVWQHLHIVENETIANWTAADLLLFCVYVSVFVAWLPWHFFFHRFG